MTAKELSRFFKHDEKMAQDIEDHFSEMRHWHLIRKDGEKCHAEERGKLWVAGRIVIPDCVYTINGTPIDTAEIDTKPVHIPFSDIYPATIATHEQTKTIAPIQAVLIA